jgi:hypothetical protein
LGRGNNLESILILWQIYQTLYLFFRVQECRPLTPQDTGMILLWCGGIRYSLICALGLQTQNYWGSPCPSFFVSAENAISV